jgi:hypothetical protein
VGLFRQPLQVLGKGSGAGQMQGVQRFNDGMLCMRES